MKVVKLQFHKIDKEYFFLPKFLSSGGVEIKTGTKVMVDTSMGQDIATVTGWGEFKESKDTGQDENKNNVLIPQEKDEDIRPMLRPARTDDIKKAKEISDKYPEYLERCKDLVKKHKLSSMKIIDVLESLDGKRLTVYFTSNTRVDFRELIKDLVKSYHKKIRLQQVGVRDAAKIAGDFGPCGVELCCKNWLHVIGKVSPDFIKDQELNHRGADRLTGTCGRLKCCLRFEQEAYRYNLDKLPKVGEIIKTKVGDGEVVAVHALKNTVNLRIDGSIVEYSFLEKDLCANIDNKEYTSG